MLDLLETRCSVWFAISCVSHICITDMTSLISFFLILFHYWTAFAVYQQNWVNNTTWKSLTNIFPVNHIHVRFFWGCSRIRVQKCPLPRTRQTYPTMMKISTVIPYLTKIHSFSFVFFIFSHNIKFTPFATKYKNKIIIIIIIIVIITICVRKYITDDSNKIFLV